MSNPACKWAQIWGLVGNDMVVDMRAFFMAKSKVPVWKRVWELIVPSLLDGVVIWLGLSFGCDQFGVLDTSKRSQECNVLAQRSIHSPQSNIPCDAGESVWHCTTAVYTTKIPCLLAPKSETRCHMFFSDSKNMLPGGNSQRWWRLQRPLARLWNAAVDATRRSLCQKFSFFWDMVIYCFD